MAAGMVTLKGSMSTEGERLPSFCPTLQVLDMSTLDDAADVNPIARMWQELDYGIDICRVTKGGHIKRL
jgi:hypothetical protein